MLKNTTFCVLLAAALMMMGATAGAFMKMDEEADGARQALASADKHEQANVIMPVSGDVVEPFGAKYSEEYGQWSLVESVSVELNGAQAVCAPMDCTVGAVESLDGGGSCVTLTEGEVQIRLQPIYNLRVFAGTKLAAGDMLAEAEGVLEIYMERDGMPTDPVKELAPGSSGE